MDEVRKHLADREGIDLVGDIPAASSGVTIGPGLDLGQFEERELRVMGIQEHLIDRFRPYLEYDTRDAVRKANLDETQLRITQQEADHLMDVIVAKHVDAVAPFTKNMGVKGGPALISLRHWSGKLGNTNDRKLAFDGVNHVYNTIKGGTATEADLAVALGKTLENHRKGTAAYNRIRHEKEYLLGER